LTENFSSLTIFPVSKFAQTKEDFSIVLSGEAGQGLLTLEQLITRIFKLSGYHVFSYSEFMSRIRGGNNSTQIRISCRRVASYRRRIDIFVPLHTGAMERFQNRITPETVILGDLSFIDSAYTDKTHPIVDVPIVKIAKDIGGEVYINVILVGLFSGLFCLDTGLLEDQIRLFFSKAGEDRIQKNIEAARKGYDQGSHVLKAGQVLPILERSEEVTKEFLINGVDAIGIGGLLGGCTFVSSYPMSPSTNLLVFFSRYAKEFGLVVEQTEDEISAINMALGSWYAGGKALVTTSGGGYALMVEGLSLAGSIESPLVIHLGQRPGPATGLPTRTEQADLEHALYSGHGEFPRLILAPGTIKEGFDLARHAFYMADKFQIPVFILTDQHFLESTYTVDTLDIPAQLHEGFVVETDEGYKRYRLTDNGVSPRGIPGFGSGLVCVDSDEHDEAGYITEDLQMRTAMVDKRLRKLKSMEPESIPPTLIGSEDSRYLVVGWGSTFNVVKESLDILMRKDLAFLHFSQVYPLYPKAPEIMKRFEKRIIIENNATAQFGKLIRQQTGIEFEGRILKYDGLPFMLEEVVEKLEALL
jgi:2-oxoglutarate/2-oxoacid ferredoxin oxidoreductase subunit alpha